MKWDAYIHTNGQLIIKILWGDESTIERDSPFVTRYISPVEAETREEAERLLILKAKNE
jgi:hypothetical protein